MVVGAAVRRDVRDERDGGGHVAGDGATAPDALPEEPKSLSFAEIQPLLEVLIVH